MPGLLHQLSVRAVRPRFFLPLVQLLHLLLVNLSGLADATHTCRPFDASRRCRARVCRLLDHLQHLVRDYWREIRLLEFVLHALILVSVPDVLLWPYEFCVPLPLVGPSVSAALVAKHADVLLFDLRMEVLQQLLVSLRSLPLFEQIVGRVLLDDDHWVVLAPAGMLSDL